MEKKDVSILGIVILFDWDKLCDPYVYDQNEILEDALCLFPNAKSDKKDIRQKQIEIMECSAKDFSMIIKKERKKTALEGPLLECCFTYDNVDYIRGIFWRHGIRFFSKDKVSEDIKNNLIDFIKSHTPTEFHGEIFIHQYDVEDEE